MASAVLVQEEREPIQATRTDLGVRLVSVDARIGRIAISKQDKTIRGNPGQFDFDVNLDESGRSKDSLTVRYSFTVGNASTGQTCSISGEAKLVFTNLNPETDLDSVCHDIDNDMAVQIFRQNYETVFLLHDALGLTAPSPWVTQDVSLSSRSA